MITGILALSIGFVAAAVSTAGYWLYYRDQDERFLNLANRSFVIMGAGILFSVVLLYYNIFSHNFQLNYVYSYTSLKLSTYYLISTFWAGQEGTFLLWLLFGTVFGIIMIRTVGKKEPMALFFLMLVQTFLLLILLKKSPFAMIWHTHADVPPGFTPVDGASLNPLLQNPWMIIHPPIMFLGYSSTVAAFAFALNALVKKEFSQWIKYARPWVVFASLMLGAGIILGGYWSYVTLGWGGYWAWDPVENASIVPWLFSLVLLHGLIIQSRQKGLVKTNLFLAGMAFISVLWGSFLTRSGVLGDFSVHSFAESDLNLYLITLVLLFSGIFLYQYFKSVKNVVSSKFAEGIFSRETFILFGMMCLLFTGITIFVGTSSPIYTRLFGEPSNVSIDFYNTVSIPIGIVMLFSMGLSPILAWKVSELRNKTTLLYGLGVALLVTFIGFLFGLNQWVTIILIFLSVFTIYINGHVSYYFIKKNPSKSGGYLAHMGIAFMIIGIITSSLYDTSEKVSLPAGEFKSTQFGYDLQFVNFVKKPNGKDRVRMIVKKHDGVYEADPQFYYSEYTKSYMLSPHVKRHFGKDIYISPISFMPAQFANIEEVELTKNQSRTIDNMKIVFNEFIIGDHSGESPMIVKADLSVSVSQNNYWQDYSIQPVVWFDSGKMQAEEVSVPETGYKIRIQKLDANQGRVMLALLKPEDDNEKPKDILAVEVSEKPLISILWFGTVMMMIGVAIALVDRMKSA